MVGNLTLTFFETVIGNFTSDELDRRPAGKVAFIGDIETNLNEGAVESGLWRILGMSISLLFFPGYALLIVRTLCPFT